MKDHQEDDNSRDLANARYTRDDLVRDLKSAQRLGFISNQSIDNQIQHSLDLISLIPKEFYSKSRILDLGAGGGLPSLVWLHKDPNIEITAVDAMKKRIDFLSNISLENETLTKRLNPIQARAEFLAHDRIFKEQYQLLVARGFAAPSITAECGSGFIEVGGHMAVSGRPDDESLRWNEEKLIELGLRVDSVYEAESAHVTILEKISNLDNGYPRRFASIKKRPLF